MAYISTGHRELLGKCIAVLSVLLGPEILRPWIEYLT